MDKNKAIELLKNFYHEDFISSLPEDSHLHKILTVDLPQTENLRIEINNCLELVHRYKLLDADLEARLRSPDEEIWQSAMNELRVALQFENLFGTDCLHWHPQGREKKVGEFELLLSKVEEPIFVEVKTVFPRDLERLEQRITEKLFRYAEQVPITSFLNVHVEAPGTSESFSGRKFKNYLIRELSAIKADDLKQKSFKLPDYEDNNTGLHLQIETLAIIPNEEEESCHIGISSSGAKFIKNEVYILHSLYKAYAQLPVEKQPCLVILCSSTAFPINEHIMLNALLGTLALRVYQSIDRTAKVPEPEPFRKSDGFFQSRRNRKLSAVGLYKEKLAETGMEVDLEIYHNPFTVNQLKDSLFKGKGIRQLVKKNDQEMEWINKIV